MYGNLLLLGLILIGIIGRSSIIATAAGLLLIMKLSQLEHYFPLIERRGIELGLLFLTIAVLVPFADGNIGYKDVLDVFTSWPGILALAGGMIATYMNGEGLNLLKIDPELIVGLVLGSIIGIFFMRGIPVGPLMAAGITALLLKFFSFFLR